MKVVDRRDRHVPNADDEITRRDASAIRRTSLLYARNEHGSRRCEMKAVGLASRQMNRLSGDANVRATNSPIAHQSRCDAADAIAC